MSGFSFSFPFKNVRLSLGNIVFTSISWFMTKFFNMEHCATAPWHFYLRTRPLLTRDTNAHYLWWHGKMYVPILIMHSLPLTHFNQKETCIKLWKSLPSITDNINSKDMEIMVHIFNAVYNLTKQNRLIPSDTDTVLKLQKENGVHISVFTHDFWQLILLNIFCSK
jgi:hypothetical protein